MGYVKIGPNVQAVLLPHFRDIFVCLSRSYEKLSRSDEKLSRSNEKVSRSNDKTISF